MFTEPTAIAGVQPLRQGDGNKEEETERKGIRDEGRIEGQVKKRRD